jgi:hypothetical protein
LCAIIGVTGNINACCLPFALDFLVFPLASARRYFSAQIVNVNPLKLMLGSMFSAEVTLADQPGTPVTATFETIATYLEKYDEGAQTFMVKPEP